MHWSASGAGQFFLIALIQDDEEDGDRDDGTDLNGVVVVRSEAVRPDGLRRSVEALVAREAGDPGHGIPASVRVLRWGRSGEAGRSRAYTGSKGNV